jgi:hypothetical protein
VQGTTSVIKAVAAWLLAFMLTVAAAVVVIHFVNAKVYGPGQQISSYFEALQEGDGERALGLLSAKVPQSNAALLDGDALRAAAADLELIQIGEPRDAGDNRVDMDVTYTVTGNTGTDAGSYSMTVVGVGNFIGTVHVPWTIEERIVISITVPTDEYLYTGDSQDVTIVVKDENGNDIPYHLEYFDMEGNNVEFKDVGRYTVRVVIDDSMYIIDGSSAFVVEIVDVPEPVEESFNVWLLFLVLFIAVLAAYLPLSYIFGFGFARWCIVLLPVALATILSMILGGILIIDTGGWLMVFEISIAAMSLYFPISYMRNK